MTETVHPLDPADAAFMAQLRAMTAPFKGQEITREQFDETMEQVADAPGVRYEPGVADGISGMWCFPDGASKDAVILYIHGGAYVAGTAFAFRHQAGQVAARTRTAAFIPDYRLAPEHHFPGAVDDVARVYDDLSKRFRNIAIAGDSAGGGLALILCAMVRDNAGIAPVACAVMSPWTDLALTGASMTERAAADPLLTRHTLEDAAAAYLNGADPRAPKASPLYGDLGMLPPILISVGADEILLDDARRYFDGARMSGSDIALHIWEGLPHVFESNVGKLFAADAAWKLTAAFLSDHLGKLP